MKNFKYLDISDATIMNSLLRIVIFLGIELNYLCLKIADLICWCFGLDPYALSSNWIVNTVVAVYMLTKDLFFKKSIFKHICRLDIVDKDGNDAKLWQRFVRNITLAFPFVYMVDMLVGMTYASLHDSPRRLGDFIAGTYVISSSKRTSFKREVASKQLRQQLDEKGLLNNDDDIYEFGRKRDESDHL